MDQQSLLERLRGSEWEDLELKEATGGASEDAYKTVSAFANSGGGWLVFGIREAAEGFQVCGLPDLDKLLNEFSTVCRSPEKFSRPLDVQPKQYLIDDKQVLAFYVRQISRFDKPLRVRVKKRWESYIRVGSGDHRCTEEEEARFLRDASYETFDTTACEDATLEDLDEEAVRWLRGSIALRQPERSYPELSTEEYLANIGLLRGDGQLTNAAGLLLGQEHLIRRLQPGGIVDFRLFHNPWGAEQQRRWDDRELCEGNLVTTVRTLSERIQRLVPQPFAMEDNGIQHRAQSPDYLAFREALVNLLVHQDYTDRIRMATVLWYLDRAIFENPGDSFVELEEMLAGGTSKRRNPLLVQVMRP